MSDPAKCSPFHALNGHEGSQYQRWSGGVANASTMLTLSGQDRSPVRHQVTEIYSVRARVVEYQLHRLRCRLCGHLTRGSSIRAFPRRLGFEWFFRTSDSWIKQPPYCHGLL